MKKKRRPFLTFISGKQKRNEISTIFTFGVIGFNNFFSLFNEIYNRQISNS